MKNERKGSAALMDTEAGSKAAASISKVEELYTGNVQIEQIHTNGNFRKAFNEAKMKELTESVKKVGILQPLIVRVEGEYRGPELAKDQKLTFKLIAGERRLRAAKAAGLEKVPVRVFLVDDQTAAEIQALENLHRADLTPIEEANAFKQLIDKGGYTVQALAEKVDKSEAYVYRSIRLLELPAKLLEAIEDGRLTPAHGHQILRAPEKNRESLMDFALEEQWNDTLPSVAALKERIEAKVEKDLKTAQFPKDVEYAGENPCNVCPFNSGNQGTLFDGAESGKCTNPGCFAKKTRAFEKEFQERSSGRFGPLPFIGEAKASYYGEPEINGYQVIESTAGAIKKANEQPDQYGWGIIKPNPYSNATKLKAVLLKKASKKESGQQDQATATAAYQKQQFVDKLVAYELMLAAMKEVPNLKPVQILRFLIDEMGGNSVQNCMALIDPATTKKTVNIEKLNESTLLAILAFEALQAWSVDQIQTNIKVLLGDALDVKAIRKEAQKAAEQKWEEKHSPKSASVNQNSKGPKKSK